MSFTHLDLFTGLGAFSLGFQRQGFSTIAQVEIDKNCRKLLDSKWPSVQKWDDVTTFDPDSIPCPTVVTFGSPCQDLSVAGQRAGMVGERSGLFYAATRIIQRLVGLGLEFALWENVEGAFSSNGGRDFAGVLAELGRCGALDIGYRVLDCQFWGLAQRRRRVFLVADFRGRRADQILSFESCLRGHPQTSREAGQRVAGTIGSSAQGGFRSTDLDQSGAFIPVVSRTLAARGDESPCIDRGQEFLVMAHGQANAETVSDGSPSLTCNHEAPIVIPIQSVNMVREKKQNGIGIGKPGEACYTLTGRDQHAVAFTQNQREEIRELKVAGSQSSIRRGDAKQETLIAFSTKDHGQDATQDCSPTLRAGVHKDSHSNGGVGPAVCFQSRIARNGHGVPSCAVSALQASATGDSKPLIAFQSSQSGVREVESAPTLDSHNGSRRQNGVVGNFGVRRLTPTECERLMGLPDGWTAGFSDSTRYRMIGNSAAVPVIEWLAANLRKTLQPK